MAMQTVRANGIQFNVVQQGRGLPLLLAHGFPLDHSMWRGQIDALSDICRVIAPDLRGFGRSEVTGGVVTMEQMADDLAALLDELEVAEPVTLCGLSMGGYVAWQFWQRHRQRLGRLVLCDTRAVADSAEAAANRRETAERVLEQGAEVVVDAMLPKLFSEATVQNRPDVIEATRQVMLAQRPASIAAALRGMAERKDMSGVLERIDVPVLVVCGQHDAISSVAEMRAIADTIPGAEFVEVPEAGHMAPLEDPPTVNASLRQFL